MGRSGGASSEKPQRSASSESRVSGNKDATGKIGGTALSKPNFSPGNKQPTHKSKPKFHPFSISTFPFDTNSISVIFKKEPEDSRDLAAPLSKRVMNECIKRILYNFSVFGKLREPHLIRNYELKLSKIERVAKKNQQCPTGWGIIFSSKRA